MSIPAPCGPLPVTRVSRSAHPGTGLAVLAVTSIGDQRRSDPVAFFGLSSTGRRCKSWVAVTPFQPPNSLEPVAPYHATYTMHDTDASGNEFFKCDFCRTAWRDDLPMVEGHRGSLICGDCLRAAFIALVLNEAGEPAPSDQVCALCLSSPEKSVWRSEPGGTPACRRCVNQSARILNKDPEAGWRIPTAPAA